MEGSGSDRPNIRMRIHNTASVTYIVLFADAAAAVPGHVPPDCGQPGDLHGRHTERLLGVLENTPEI
jgi:hypothetical protein